MIDLRGMNPAKSGEFFIELYGTDEELQAEMELLEKAMITIGYTSNAYSAHAGNIQLVYLSYGRATQAHEDFLRSDRNSLGSLHREPPPKNDEETYAIVLKDGQSNFWPLSRVHTHNLNKDKASLYQGSKELTYGVDWLIHSAEVNKVVIELLKNDARAALLIERSSSTPPQTTADSYIVKTTPDFPEGLALLLVAPVQM